jgi:hypothetical protein
MRPWGKLCAAYPRQDMGVATAAVYHERLQRYDIELLIGSVNLAIDRCVFFPTVAELIENVALLGAGRQRLLDEPRPSKEEARAVLESLHASIRDFEAADLKVNEKRIADRKEVLRKQAEMLGVKKSDS